MLCTSYSHLFGRSLTRVPRRPKTVPVAGLPRPTTPRRCEAPGNLKAEGRPGRWWRRPAASPENALTGPNHSVAVSPGIEEGGGFCEFLFQVLHLASVLGCRLSGFIPFLLGAHQESLEWLDRGACALF